MGWCHVGLVEGGMAGAIARVYGYPGARIACSSTSHVGVAERRRQAVQYAASPDAPGYCEVSWVDFRVSQMNFKLERRLN